MLRFGRGVLCASMVCLAAGVPCGDQAAVPAGTEDGFVPLFDGSSLAGWTGPVDGYRAENGELVCAGEGSGHIYSEREYADFVVRLEFALTPGSNQGIGLRTPREGRASYAGIEIQLLDNTAERYADLAPYQYCGSAYGVIAAKRGYLREVGAWNEMEIRYVGSQLSVVLNGETIVDGDVRPFVEQGTPDHQEHPGLTRTCGHLVLCGHGSVVRFRNLRIREIAGTKPAGK